jgi:hypothetical protein
MTAAFPIAGGGCAGNGSSAEPTAPSARRLPPFLELPADDPAPPRRRDLRLAVLLAALFGPLGLFYASPQAGLLMTIVTLVVGLFTVGVGVVFAWPVCVLWAYSAAS